MRQNGAAAGRGKKEVSGMISFLLCLAILVGGYFVYMNNTKMVRL